MDVIIPSDETSSLIVVQRKKEKNNNFQANFISYDKKKTFGLTDDE